MANKNHDDRRLESPEILAGGVPGPARVLPEPASWWPGPSSPEAFSRALVSAMNSQTPSALQAKPSRDSIAPPQGSTIPSVDPTTAWPGLGALLAGDPSPLHEARPGENASLPVDLGVPGRGGPPGGGPGVPFRWPASPPIGGPVMIDARERGEGGSPEVGSQRLSIEQDRSLASKLGVSGPAPGSTPPAGGPNGLNSPGTTLAGAGGPPTDRQTEGRVGVNLPGLVTLANQSTFGSGATDPQDRPFETLSSFVNLDPSPVAAGAFGPVLAGPGGSGYGNFLPALDAAGGRQESPASSPTADAVPGQEVPMTADPAGGPALDLSKTNELLQQLLDEVRKGHQSFLPLDDRNSPHF